MEFLFADMDGAEDGLLCLLDNLACSVGVFVVKDGIVHLRYLNDEYYAMLGTKRSERLQRFTECPLDAVHPDDLPGLMKELSACLEEERALNYSMRLKNGQDRYTWVNVRANRMGCKENSTLLYAVYSDLTEERTILNQLEETSASLHAAVSCSSLHSWVYFPKERRMVFTGGEHSGLPNVIELNNFPDTWVEMGMVHPDDVSAYLAEYKKIDDGAKSSSCDVRIKNVDGWHWERINLISLYDANGERTKVIGIAELLDDYKELEMRFSIAAAQSGLTTWVYDIAEKKMIIDSSSSNITNCPSIVENVPESLFEMNAVHPDDAESVRETFQAIGQGIKKFAVCDARWREDGKNWCWRRVFYTVIFDKNDRPIKAIGSSIDISEQKEAEEKYRKYRENVAAVTPNALGSFHLNITKNLCFDGTSRYAVVRALDKDGTAGSFLDTLKTMIPDRAERETFYSIFERDSLLTAFEQGRSFLSLDYKASIGKEAPAWVSTCISMVKNPASGDVEGIIYAIDINEKKLAEQKTNRELEAALKKAECAIASKGEFLSRMSHDMRTPLNAIIGLSELAIENKTDAAETISYMEKIHASGQYLLGLINDILNMPKIESKKMKLNLEYTEASNLFKRIRQIINPIMKEKNINFFFDTDDFGKKYILTDSIHLQQIFINLLSNSAKFTPAGGNIACSVKIIKNLGDSVVAKMVFRDDGIGMSKEFLTRVFEPFEQENSSLGGTGLGLTIVKSLTDLMGGKLSVESEKERGTTVTLTLEMKVTDKQPCASKCPSANSSSLAGKRILVAEDQEVNLLVAVKILESKGAVTESAPDGYETAQKFSASSENYYDAILMDIKMPVMDGFAATEKIRAMDRSDARTIPIIAMTANAFDEDIEAAKKCGMDGHTPKPIVPEQLIETLCCAIEGRNNPNAKIFWK